MSKISTIQHMKYNVTDMAHTTLSYTIPKNCIIGDSNQIAGTQFSGFNSYLDHFYF